jgi:hypothetical protein
MEFFGKVGFQETLLLLSSRKPCIEDSSSTKELFGNKSFVLSWFHLNNALMLPILGLSHCSSFISDLDSSISMSSSFG